MAFSVQARPGRRCAGSFRPQFLLMSQAKKHASKHARDGGHQEPASPWKGDAVAPESAEEAADAADRAAGRSPEAAERAAEPEDEEQQPRQATRRPASGQSVDEKIAEAAEAHRERLRAEGRGPRGKL